MGCVPILKLETVDKSRGEKQMERYKNLGRDSGVAAYEIGPDFIRVQFNDGWVYLYTYVSAGAQNIEHMKQLATHGQGLNAFINTNVRKAYARKER
jgi:hypothetical protein